MFNIKIKHIETLCFSYVTNLNQKGFPRAFSLCRLKLFSASQISSQTCDEVYRPGFSLLAPMMPACQAHTMAYTLGDISHIPTHSFSNFPLWYYVQKSLFSNFKNFLCGSGKRRCTHIPTDPTRVRVRVRALCVPHGVMKPQWPWYEFTFLRRNIYQQECIWQRSSPCIYK